MTPKSLALALFCLLASTEASAEQRVLRGKVLLVDKNDKTRPASKGEVWLLGFGNPTRIASKDGSFRLFLPDALQPTDSITLVVDIKGYRLWSPPDGQTLVPKNLATQFVELQVLPVGSKRFLSDDSIERLIRNAAAEPKEQTKANEAPPRFELSRYIQDWALQYGFSAEQVKAEVDRWVAEVEKNRDDEYRLALAAFARGDFQETVEHSDVSAERNEQQLEQLERETEQKKRVLRENIARDRELKGAAQLQREDFTGALESYTQALKHVSRTENPERWASLMTGVAAAHGGLGSRAANARAHLEAAVAAYRSALEIQTREAQPQQWAMTQNNLGLALQAQGERTEGEDRARLLSEAEDAYRLALRVHTREALPQDWARTQRNLDLALEAQRRVSPP